jgi:aryl-alcohol dehydrogenase-like predicted oxidoreductase
MRTYGNSGLVISSLGLGAGQVGDANMAETDANRLLNYAANAGITLIDTAPSYGLSEQRIGAHLSHRRRDFVLSTKLGYGVVGIEDWTGACITAGVERALHLMRTDRIDIAHLHSCPKETLMRDDVIEALVNAKRAGKVRAIAYSGENEDLAYAIGMNQFDGFMASLNIFDQRVIDEALPKISDKGFIAKRPSANHPWRFNSPPVGDYCEEYWRRFRKMNLDNFGMEWGELALRFTLSIPHVASAIVGTGNIEHLKKNIAWSAKGPLDVATVNEIRRLFQQHDDHWRGQI